MILQEKNISSIRFYYEIKFSNQICKDLMLIYVLILVFVFIILILWIALNCRLNQNCEVMNKCYTILLGLLIICIILMILFLLTFSPDNYLSEFLKFMIFIFTAFYDSFFIVFSLYLGFVKNYQGIEIVKSNFSKEDLSIFTIISSSYYMIEF